MSWGWLFRVSFSQNTVPVPFWQADPRLVLFQFPSLGALVKHRLAVFCLSFYFFCVCLVFLMHAIFPFCFYSKFFLLLLYIFFVVLLYGNHCLLSSLLHDEIFNYNLHLFCGYIFLMGSSGLFCFLPAFTYALLFLSIKYCGGSILITCHWRRLFPSSCLTNRFLQVWLICGISFVALPSLLFRTKWV